MAISLDEIVEEAAQLPEDVLAELIERSVVSHHGGIEPGIEAAWKTKKQRWREMEFRGLQSSAPK